MNYDDLPLPGKERLDGPAREAVETIATMALETAQQLDALQGIVRIKLDGELHRRIEAALDQSAEADGACAVMAVLREAALS